MDIGDIGNGLTTNLLYDITKHLAFKFINRSVTKDELKTEIESYLKVKNTKINAEGVLQALVDRGQLRIEGSELLSQEAITFGSVDDGRFMFSSSTSATPKTRIDTGINGSISGAGTVQQTERGDIIISS